MAYQVTARKWRPRTFEEVVGQEHMELIWLLTEVVLELLL